jgi:hypothetical protein
VLPAEMNAKRCPDITAANDSEVESDIWDADYIISQAKAMACVREKINAKTMSNIKIAQAKDKAYYDKKHANSKVTAIFICTILTYIYLIYRS